MSTECSNILEAALAQPNFSGMLKKGSIEKELVTDLQRILFELGFKKELKCDQYNADGDYGNVYAREALFKEQKDKDNQ
ncbi:MAG: hypothetical protein KJO05_06230 [Bacteroidia bacterium]|nr:hypothetical protein [Bacteroidia bacterium]MBT8274699.1 hypothetical protein [Bacteroidia bacterium]NNJ81334.1 hypothetical protein [Flavobacteriaceae bacterium]NNK55376.1 hypothetical protein [Flavobacteriaceae bacterium]NNM09216.1 hypothetical protein [Flavobacteriaceae bacterium]